VAQHAHAGELGGGRIGGEHRGQARQQDARVDAERAQGRRQRGAHIPEAPGLHQRRAFGSGEEDGE
jgi:hypothetical protein